MLNKLETKQVISILKKMYPDAGPELIFSNPFELLIAVILSAQCTDVRVNKVTKELFNKYPKPEDYIGVSIEEIGEIIHSCGFYKTKSEYIINTCKILIDKYKGNVPSNKEDLLSLPGVGNKTANVVMSTVFNVPAIAVDTHVFRVSQRIGLAKGNSADEIEKKLCHIIEKEEWTNAHHLIIFHGRRICKARKPLCMKCKLKDICEYNEKNLL